MVFMTYGWVAFAILLSFGLFMLVAHVFSKDIVVSSRAGESSVVLFVLSGLLCACLLLLMLFGVNTK